MIAYLFPQDGAWMLKIGKFASYYDTKQEGIDAAQDLLNGGVPIETLKVTDTNNGF